MPAVDRRTALVTTAGMLGTAALTLAASIRARGPRRALLFAALGTALPVAGELYGINRMRVLRHHLQPQIKGLPLGIACGWYIIGYNTFALVEPLVDRLELSEAQRRALLPLATALTATSLDLVADVALLEQGFWEWTAGGGYAPEVVGPNGVRGIPAENYALWLALTSSVTLLYLAVSGDTGAEAEQQRATAHAREAALLLLPSYLVALGWELRRRRLRYLGFSALFPIVLGRGLLGKPRA